MHNNLKQRIAILKHQITTDKAGGEVESWDLIAKVWAKIKFSRNSSHQLNAITKHYQHFVITIRPLNFGLKRGMKLIYKNENFYVSRILVMHKDYLKFEMVARI